MPAARKPAAARSGPASDDALLALPADHAAHPDIPVLVAIREYAGLARLANARATALKAVGITAAQRAALAALTSRLAALEKAWNKAHAASFRSAKVRVQIKTAEALKQTLLAAGDWAFRKDPDALSELAHIREGTGLDDTIQDLRDLHAFWSTRSARLATTRATSRDVAQAASLAAELDEAATEAAGNSDAAEAQDLRNRCFWAADELANEIREGGRYALSDRPKLAAKFVSRYRATKQRVHRRRKSAAGDGAPLPPSGTPTSP